MAFTLSRCLIVAAFFIAQAAASAAPGETAKIRVVTSISPLADMVANVGGRRVAVANFVPVDVDPHTFEPTFSSLSEISRAQVIILNGDDLDRAARQSLMALASKGCLVVDLSQSIPASRKNKIDPHYWLDLQFAQIYVSAIARALAKVDPAHAQYFQDNAGRYARRITELDSRYASLCAKLPARCKSIILYHNSWTYLATRYGFNVVGIIEASGTREPSARSLAMLIRRARAAGARAILAEPGHGSRILETVRQGAAVPRVLEMIEDSLRAPPCNTYLGMMEADLKKLAVDICKD